MTSEITRRNFLGAAAAAAASSAGSEAAERRASSEPQPAAAPGRERTTPVVDSHVHLKHGDAARTEYSPDQIVETMDMAGIDRSVVFAMSTTTKRSIEMAEAAVKKYPDRLIPYVYALPHYERPVVKEIEAALAGRVFRGIKIHAGECTLADYVVDPVLRIAGKHAVACLIDCLGNYAAAKRMAQAFPGTKLIIAHMGRYLSTDKRLIEQFIGLAEQSANVLLDVSGVVVPEMIVQAVRRIGSSRMLWGTDGPHPKPDTATFARTELDKIRHLGLSRQDTDNLLGRTILRLLTPSP